MAPPVLGGSNVRASTWQARRQRKPALWLREPQVDARDAQAYFFFAEVSGSREGVVGPVVDDEQNPDAVQEIDTVGEAA